MFEDEMMTITEDELLLHEWLARQPATADDFTLCLIAAYREQVAKPSIDECLYHRCFEHRAVPRQNVNEFSGAECGGCIAAERDEFKGLLEVERANNAETERDSLRTELAIQQSGRCTSCMEPVSPIHPRCACVRSELTALETERDALAEYERAKEKNNAPGS